jgi:hypothetical protein
MVCYMSGDPKHLVVNEASIKERWRTKAACSRGCWTLSRMENMVVSLYSKLPFFNSFISTNPNGTHAPSPESLCSGLPGTQEAVPAVVRIPSSAAHAPAVAASYGPRRRRQAIEPQQSLK